MSSPAQRFRKSSPCPICQGYADLPPGQGKRCWGFLSNDGEYAHCTREEYAGTIKADPNEESYAHRLLGDCQCGVRHDPNPSYTSSNGHKPQIIATYGYVDKQGILLYETVRYHPKGFRQRRPNGNGNWVWNLHNVRHVIYRLPAIVEAISKGQTICTTEGEEDVYALEAHGYAATCNHGGAGKWTDLHSCNDPRI